MAIVEDGGRSRRGRAGVALGAAALIGGVALGGADARAQTMSNQPMSNQAVPGQPGAMEAAPSAPAAGPPLLVPGQAMTPAPALQPGPFADLWTRSNLLGDIGGLRPWLDAHGVTLGLTETSEVLGNVTGGIHQGADYEGLTQMTLSIDTQKAFGWTGGTFNVSALQIHGRSLADDNLSNLQTPSGIAANRTTRLWELWYQQALPNGWMDVKLGQQSIDNEFMTSTNSALFLNTMMGWPMVPSADLYAGGPAYPLSSLGARFRATPTDALTLLAGVFDDNPSGGPFDDDSQLRGAERSGTKFNLNTGALIIGEIQYAINQPAVGKMDYGSPWSGLPGTYKLGFWYDTASFPDQRYDDTGLSLADPSTTGIAAMRRGNYSIYAVADQMIWRPEPGGARALGAFARLMGAPGDRNLIAFSVNAGLDLKAPLAGRDNDTFGVGFGVTNVSDGAAGLDRDTAFFGGASYPVRGTESFIEVTYQYQLTPWWQLQPDFQYVFNPGGGLQNPNNPDQRIGDEAIFGLRTIVTF